MSPTGLAPSGLLAATVGEQQQEAEKVKHEEGWPRLTSVGAKPLLLTLLLQSPRGMDSGARCRRYQDSAGQT